MAGGLTPYDKENYRQSKKRRRQAIVEEKTGRIVPISGGRKRIVSVVCAVLILALAASAFFAASYFSSIKAEESEKAETDSESDEVLLRVVNAQNPLDESYAPETFEIAGVSAAVTLREALEDMLNAAEADGITLTIKSGYVSYEQQQTLYEQKLNEYLESGEYSQVRAEAAARKEVPQAGESEAQTGLLIEFDASDGKAASWLEDYSVNYGFVKRYTEDKEDVTGMNASDSLYRYVGEEYALKMRAFGMCLEEFAEYISIQKLGS